MFLVLAQRIGSADVTVILLFVEQTVMFTCSVCLLERPQGAPSLVDSHAEVRPPSLLPQPQDPWTELPHPRGNDNRLQIEMDSQTWVRRHDEAMAPVWWFFCGSALQNCTFGYHAGGWGKPPVDEMGKPLYGDVFGTNATDFQVRTSPPCRPFSIFLSFFLYLFFFSSYSWWFLIGWRVSVAFCVQSKAEEEEVDRTPWGELEPSDEESSEEEEEEESDEEKPDETGFFTPADRCLMWTIIGTYMKIEAKICDSSCEAAVK